MKNNRKNRKRISMYFKNMNKKYGLSKELSIVPTYLFGKGHKTFSVLIGSLNNPRSEIITRPLKSTRV